MKGKEVQRNDAEEPAGLPPLGVGADLGNEAPHRGAAEGPGGEEAPDEPRQQGEDWEGLAEARGRRGRATGARTGTGTAGAPLAAAETRPRPTQRWGRGPALTSG